jgi:glutamyl-tRNA(Gln) amidotransferase subunit E
MDVSDMYARMGEWGIPEDTHPYLLRNNLFPLVERITGELEVDPVFVGTLFGHTLKRVEGRFPRSEDFRYEQVFEVLQHLQRHGIEPALAREMLPELYQNPRMDMDSILTILKFRKIPEEHILEKIPYLCRIAEESGVSADPGARSRWMMGELRPTALGNISLADLFQSVISANSGNGAAASPEGRES